MKINNFYVNRFNGAIIMLKRVLPYFNLSKYKFEEQQQVLLHFTSYDEVFIEIQVYGKKSKKVMNVVISATSFMRLYVLDEKQDAELKLIWNQTEVCPYFVENVTKL